VRAEEGDYVLPVDKPAGPTSHDVVAAARRALGTRRVGHTGTLDPFASGLLLLCVGRATRLAEYLSGLDKRYEATARLGVETDTLDHDGEVVREAELAGLAPEAVLDALAGFAGAQDQVPPQYSAKKVAGEAMHRRARRGEQVELEPVRVTVYSVEALEVTLPEVRFAVHCSSGTYIRAIARDLGRALGVGAHLTALRRTAIGRFSVEDAVAVDQLDDTEGVAAARIAPIDAVGHLREIAVGEEEADRLRHGQRLRVEAPATDGTEDAAASRSPERVAVAHAGTLLAIGDLDDGVLRPRKVFAG
jgi:tRNA pseudouridine55 synthase